MKPYSAQIFQSCIDLLNKRRPQTCCMTAYVAIRTVQGSNLAGFLQGSNLAGFLPWPSDIPVMQPYNLLNKKDCWRLKTLSRISGCMTGICTYKGSYPRFLPLGSCLPYAFWWPYRPHKSEVKTWTFSFTIEDIKALTGVLQATN